VGTAVGLDIRGTNHEDPHAVGGHWIRAAASWSVLDAAKARGFEPADILARAQREAPPEDLRAMIPLELHFAIWTAAIKLIDDPGFVVDVGTTVTHENFEVVGLAARAAPDLEHALRVMQRFGHVYSNDNGFEIDADPRGLWGYMPPSGALPLAARCATEAIVVQVVHVARSLVQAEFRPLEVTLRHRAPASTARLDAFFGVSPRFETPRTAILFAVEDLTRPIATADALLHQVLLRQAEAELQQLPRDETFTARVADAVQRLLPSGDVSIATVSRQLACSERTLRRRLGQEDTKFSGVVDEVRRSLAARYLDDERLAVEEVAVLVGFSDARAFRRAYVRWTGESPGDRRSAARSRSRGS
jgi:AraC-like DNA-binding protein